MTTKTKAIGSAKARKIVKQTTKRVLDRTKNLTPTEAAEELGLGVDDIRNLRQGTGKFSVPMLVKMVKAGFDPGSILYATGTGLRKHKRPTRGVQQRFINKRIGKLAYEHTGKELAKLTGLSVTGAYGLRYNTDAHVTLYTILGFVEAGYTLDELVFGG